MPRLDPDALATMVAEIEHAVAFLRAKYPEDTEADLRARAEALRGLRYQSGRWPFDEVSSAPAEASPTPMEAEPTSLPGKEVYPKRKRGRPLGSKNRPRAPEGT